MQPVGRILSKKQRKRLEKIVDVKKKKENRAQLLKVSTVPTPAEMIWFQAIPDLSGSSSGLTFGLLT